MSSAATAVAQVATPKVYSYSRWSTPEQAKGDSFRRQARAAEKWAERNGLELDESLRSDMNTPDIVRPGQIRNRPRHPQHAVITTRRQSHRTRRLAQ